MGRHPPCPNTLIGISIDGANILPAWMRQSEQPMQTFHPDSPDPRFRMLLIWIFATLCCNYRQPSSLVQFYVHYCTVSSSWCYIHDAHNVQCGGLVFHQFASLLELIFNTCFIHRGFCMTLLLGTAFILDFSTAFLSTAVYQCNDGAIESLLIETSFSSISWCCASLPWSLFGRRCSFTIPTIQFSARLYLCRYLCHLISPM